ncbi:hypothetical protein PS15m_010126 [Mucor circinelloides]
MKVSAAPLMMRIVTTRGGDKPNHWVTIKLKRSIKLKWPTIDKLYWKVQYPCYLYEICKLSFPRSLEELSSFVSLKNLNTLMRISEMFWRMCKPVSAQDVDILSDKYRPTHPSLYTLIDGTKNRHRA